MFVNKKSRQNFKEFFKKEFKKLFLGEINKWKWSKLEFQIQNHFETANSFFNLD